MIESHRFKDTERYLHPEVRVWDREHPELEARIAIEFVTKWGMVAALPDGEDSSGRQKLRMHRPAEMVDRAIECAGLLAEVLRKRGWMHITPSMIPVEKEDTDAGESK